MLETFRLRRIIAGPYHIDPKNIHGYVLGDMVTLHLRAISECTVNVAGLGLEHIDEYFHFDDKLDKKAIEQALVNRAYDIINLKGYTNTGIAMVAARFTKSFMYNEHTILPMSAVLEGEYGLRRRCTQHSTYDLC